MIENLLCLDCKRSRKTSSGKLICTGIGDPLLAYKYGRCRRFEQRGEPQRNNNERTAK